MIRVRYVWGVSGMCSDDACQVRLSAARLPFFERGPAEWQQEEMKRGGRRSDLVVLKRSNLRMSAEANQVTSSTICGRRSTICSPVGFQPLDGRLGVEAHINHKSEITPHFAVAADAQTSGAWWF